MSESKLEPMPDWDESLSPNMPDFIAAKPDPESFEATAAIHNIRRSAKAKAGEFKQETAKKPPLDDEPIKAKPYMVGDANLDEYPTETAGMRTKSDGPLTHGEIETLNRAGDDRKKIAETRKKLFH